MGEVPTYDMEDGVDGCIPIDDAGDPVEYEMEEGDADGDVEDIAEFDGEGDEATPRVTLPRVIVPIPTSRLPVSLSHLLPYVQRVNESVKDDTIIAYYCKRHLLGEAKQMLETSPNDQSIMQFAMGISVELEKESQQLLLPSDIMGAEHILRTAKEQYTTILEVLQEQTDVTKESANNMHIVVALMEVAAGIDGTGRLQEMARDCVSEAIEVRDEVLHCLANDEPFVLNDVFPAGGGEEFSDVAVEEERIEEEDQVAATVVESSPREVQVDEVADEAAEAVDESGEALRDEPTDDGDEVLQDEGIVEEDEAGEEGDEDVEGVVTRVETTVVVEEASVPPAETGDPDPPAPPVATVTTVEEDDDDDDDDDDDMSSEEKLRKQQFAAAQADLESKMKLLMEDDDDDDDDD